MSEIIKEDVLNFYNVSKPQNVTRSTGEFMKEVRVADFLDYAEQNGVTENTIDRALAFYDNVDIDVEDTLDDAFVWKNTIRGLWHAGIITKIFQAEGIGAFIKLYTKDFYEHIKVTKQIQNYESNYEKRKKEADLALDGLEDWESLFDWLGANVKSIFLTLPDNHRYDYQLATRFKPYIPANNDSGISWGPQAYPSLYASIDKKAFKALQARAANGANEKVRAKARQILSDLLNWACGKFDFKSGEWITGKVFDETTCQINSIMAVMELLEKSDFHPVIKKDVWQDDEEEESVED